MVNAWNVGELDQMVLPPCHYGFQVYTRELSASERITYKNTKQINLLDSNELQVSPLSFSNLAIRNGRGDHC